MLLTNQINFATDMDLLTILLGNRRTAEKMLKGAGGSIFALLNQTPDTTGDLFCGEGMKAYAGNPLTKLQAARELAARSLTEQLQTPDALTSPKAVRDFLKLRIGGLQHEAFVVLFLDAQHRVIEVEEMFRGTLTQTSVYPREVVKAALKSNAAAVILAHNHPSGVPEPSAADEALTRSLRSALAVVDIRVLDHFIVAGTSTLSFAERGLL